MSHPENLYHYTSINSLALILANRTIRFTALNKVNDLIEGHSEDMGDLGMFMFVSCWTDQEEEHLPLWNMYTPNLRGVRIQLPLPVFPTYKHNNIESFLPESQQYTRSYMAMPKLEHIRKIEYTDDQSLLKPKTIVNMGNGYEGLNFNGIGRYKRKIWSFEQEWRFHLEIFPKPETKHKDEKFSIDQFTELIDNRHSIKQVRTHFDLQIDQGCFNNMRVTLGPKIEPGDKEIVESLVERYNPKAKIDHSNLSGSIR